MASVLAKGSVGVSVFSELRMRPGLPTQRGWEASTASRLALAVTTISILLIGSNLATPLYPLIQADLGITPFDVTIAFTCYVFALVVGLVLAGHWSDHVGRRAVLVLAVLVGLLGAAAFASADSLGGLVLGRSLQGTSVALATGASAAALRDLLPHRPGWAPRFTLIASAGGVAVGPLLGGLLSVYPHPTRTPYLVLAVVLVLLLVPLTLLRARPPVQAAAGPHPIRVLLPQRIVIGGSARNAFWLAALVGFLSFAVFGFTLSLAPSWFAPIAGTDSRPVIGLLAGMMLFASVLSQLLPLTGRSAVPAGLATMALGMGILPVAGIVGSVPLLTASCLVAGAGQGVAFRRAFAALAAAVDTAGHAQTISAVYVITYLGSAVPVLGLGAASQFWGIDAAVLVFAVVIATACLATALLVARAAPRRR